MGRALAGFVLGLTVFFVTPLLASGAGGTSRPLDPAGPSLDEAENATAYRNGIALLHRGDNAGAARVFASVVKRDPANADGLTGLGAALWRLGRTQQAFKSFVRALKIDPHHRRAHEALGMVFLAQDKSDKAEKLLLRLRKLCPFGCEEERALAAAIAKKKAATQGAAASDGF